MEGGLLAVSPDSFERDIKFSEAINNIGQFRPVSVTPATTARVSRD